MFFAGTSLQTSKFPDEFFIIYLQKIFKSISRIRRLFLGPGGILVAAAKKATPYLLSGISARENSGRQTILPPFSQKGRLFYRMWEGRYIHICKIGRCKFFRKWAYQGFQLRSGQRALSSAVKLAKYPAEEVEK